MSVASRRQEVDGAHNVHGLTMCMGTPCVWACHVCEHRHRYRCRCRCRHMNRCKHKYRDRCTHMYRDRCKYRYRCRHM